jgi:hypothetical protein
MRTNLILSIGLAAALSCSLALGQPGGKKAAPNSKPNAAESEASLRFPLLQRSPYFGKIESVTKEGTVRSSPPDNIPQALLASDVSEGYYLAVVQESFGSSLEGARLFRAVVTDVGENGAVEFQIAKPAADALKVGELLMLFRPSGATTARLKQLPDLAAIEEGPAPGGKKEPDYQVQLAKSFNNLKQIGLALHNFHDMYNHLPPAVVMGPDEKPWHSWRIFLLPYLEEAALYNQYKFDEPWNCPNNKKLLEKMPAVYSDPIYGENKDFHTHYAAITGDGMAFSAEGAEFDGKNLNLGKLAGLGFAEFRDGTSNTLLIGPVGPDRKIPWMKPEDVKIDDTFPELGKKGSFALPYKTEKGNAGPFLRCDGSVTSILGGIDKDAFRTLVTINGGEIVDWAEVPSVSPPPMTGGTSPVIYIVREGKKTTARLVMEPLPLPQMQFPGGLPPGAIPAPARAVPPERPLPLPLPERKK